MANKKLTKKEVISRLLSAHDPVILIHRKPDGDCVGSAAALAYFFAARGERPSVLAPEPIPEHLAFLEEGLPVVPVKALTGRTVFSVDVPSLAQLGALADTYAEKNATDFMIDHHETGEPFTDFYVIPGASAAGEVLADLFFTMEKDGAHVVTKEIATALFAAISSDTGCFKYDNAAPKTHRIAAKLLERGAEAARVNHLLFDSKSEATLRAEALTASKVKTANGGKIAYAYLTRADLDLYGEEHFDTAIDVVRTLSGVEIAFTAKQVKENELRVSLRSTGADVARVAALHNGGGHVHAAGCTFCDTPAEKALETLLTALSALL